MWTYRPRASFWLALLACLVPTRSDAQSVSVDCDQTVATHFFAEGEVVNIRLGFPVVDGERVTIHVGAVPNSGSTDVTWRLIEDVGGLESSGCPGINIGRKDCGPLRTLPQPKRYVIEVSGNGLGAFRVHVQRLRSTLICANDLIPEAPCDVPLDTAEGQLPPVGLDVGTNIEYRVDGDLIPLGFQARDGEIVAVNVARVAGEAAFDPRWRLLDGAGTEVPGCGGEQSGRHDCRLVAATGPFAIDIFDGGADGIGTYLVHVQRLTSTAMCDAGVCPISERGDTDLFALTVDVASTVTIDVVGGAGGALFHPVWRLLARDGTPVAGCDEGITGSHDCGPLDPAGNPYRVEVSDDSSDSAGAYRIAVTGASTSCTCDHPCPLIPPQCGNGTTERDQGEECDEGEELNGKGQFGESCCTRDCKFRPTGFSCRDIDTVCERVAQCSGDEGSCPANPSEPDDKSCVADDDPCTLDNCSGSGQCVATNICVATLKRTSLSAKAARENKIKVECQVTAQLPEAQCAAEGRATAAQLGAAIRSLDAIGVATDAALPLPTVCEGDRIKEEQDTYRLCKSQARALKKAGSPVVVPCKPTPCLKAYLKASRTRGAARAAAPLKFEVFGIYTGIPVGTTAPPEGRRSAGIVQVRAKKTQ